MALYYICKECLNIKAPSPFMGTLANEFKRHLAVDHKCGYGTIRCVKCTCYFYDYDHFREHTKAETICRMKPYETDDGALPDFMERAMEMMLKHTMIPVQTILHAEPSSTSKTPPNVANLSVKVEIVSVATADPLMKSDDEIKPLVTTAAAPLPSTSSVPENVSGEAPKPRKPYAHLIGRSLWEILAKGFPWDDPYGELEQKAASLANEVESKKPVVAPTRRSTRLQLKRALEVSLEEMDIDVKCPPNRRQSFPIEGAQRKSSNGNYRSDQNSRFSGNRSDNAYGNMSIIDYRFNQGFGARSVEGIGYQKKSFG